MENAREAPPSEEGKDSFRYTVSGHFVCAHCAVELGPKEKVITVYTEDEESYRRSQGDAEAPFKLELALRIQPRAARREGRGASLQLKPIYMIPCSRCRRYSVRLFRHPTEEERDLAQREWLENKGVDVEARLASGRELPEPKPHERVYPHGGWKIVTTSEFVNYVRENMDPWLRRSVVQAFRERQVYVFPPSMMAEVEPTGP